MLDLVGDYAGKELFVVDGDSLLRTAWSTGAIDFDGKLPRYAPPYKVTFADMRHPTYVGSDTALEWRE